MSRSYKHFPKYKQIVHGMKRIMNKKVRAQLKRIFDSYNYSLYKKMNCSYDICDHSSTYFWQEFLHDYESDMINHYIYHKYSNPMPIIRYHRWYTWK